MALLDLPPEMLVAVSAQIRKDDLCGWRLACKTTAATSEDFFGRAYFSELNHLFTEHSLLILCRIAKHPRFARYVKRLYVAAVVAAPSNKHKFRTRLVRIERRYTLQWSRAQVGLLADALKSLGALPRPPALGYEGFHYGSPYKGANFLIKRLAISRSDLEDPGGCLHPGMFLKAVSESRYPLTSLRMDHSGIDNPQSCEVFRFRLPHPCALLRCWSSLTSLHLMLVCAANGLTAENTKTLSILLAEATQLECLNISLHGSTPLETSASAVNSLSLLAPSITSKVLKCVRLDHFDAPASVWVEFLLKHRHSLRDLDLEYALLPESECWTTVMQTFVRDLHLERLFLGDLWAGYSVLGLKGYEDKVMSLMLGNQSDVLKGLQLVMRLAEYSDIADLGEMYLDSAIESSEILTLGEHGLVPI